MGLYGKVNATCFMELCGNCMEDQCRMKHLPQHINVWIWYTGGHQCCWKYVFWWYGEYGKDECDMELFIWNVFHCILIVPTTCICFSYTDVFSCFSIVYLLPLHFILGQKRPFLACLRGHPARNLWLMA